MSFDKSVLSVWLFAAGAITMAMPCAARGQSAAQFIPIGFLPGNGCESAAYGVSADGHAVVGMSQCGTGVEAFWWSQSFGMIGLGDLPGGDVMSFASAVSADGSVIAGTATDETGVHAVIWGLGGQIVVIPGFADGDGRSTASGISANGQVVVGAAATGTGQQAFSFSGGAGLVSLGDIPMGLGLSSAQGVSSDGGLITGYSATDGGFRPFVWTESGGIQLLSAGPAEGAGYASSPSGNAIVGYRIGENGSEAFIYTINGGIEPLAGGTSGMIPANANAVSADGNTVVGDGTDSFGSRAFVWQRQFGLSDLQTLLSVDFGLADQLAGWNLTNAFAVSADGAVIVGQGVSPTGDHQAWMVRLPVNCRPPRIENIPVHVSVAAGTQFTLTATVTVSEPAAMRWRIYGFELFDNEVYSGTGTAQLTIANADASTAGDYSLDVSNECGEKLSSVVTVRLTPSCPADFNADGILNPDDLSDFITGYFSQPADPLTDFDGSGEVNPDDLSDFITAYFTGC